MSSHNLPASWPPGAGIFQDSETVFNWVTGEWEHRPPFEDEDEDDDDPDKTPSPDEETDDGV